MNFGLREKYAEIYFGISAVLTEAEHAAGGGRLVRRGSPRQGLNPMDGVEHSRSRAPHAATEMNFGLREKYAEIYFGISAVLTEAEHAAGNGRLVRRGSPRHRLNPMDGVEHSQSRAPHAATEMNFGLREKYAEIYFGISAVLTEAEHAAGGGRLVRRGSPTQRLNPMDGVEHSRSRAPHAATEMNFGLRFAGSGRLARHGRSG
jgi:hypothetical protein